MTILLAVCVACGERFGKSLRGQCAMKFCDRDCFLLHAMDHRRKRERSAAERKGHLEYAKRSYTAASKTVEQDLAWMYDGKSAFLEDSARKATRREGGAGSRRLR